jgi:tetratricopeptide (TPR) repeat protein
MTSNPTVERETKLSDSEQKLLDSALLESEQLLARSLQQDQRRRTIWWLATALFGIFAAGVAGFTAGRATADKQQTVESEDVTGDSSVSNIVSDEQWRKRLLAVKEDDSWFDGARLGMELVRISGNRSYEILSKNWQDISINARQQILKGFTPGIMGNKVLHERFFDVMNLGMTDASQEVRNFAATYLEMQGLPDSSNDPEGYVEWWRVNKDHPADQIRQAAASEAKKRKESAQAKESKHQPTNEVRTDVEPNFQQAWQLFFARNYVEAEKLFREVLEDEPKNPHAMNGLGWSLINQKKYTEAKPWINQAINIEKEHWGALSGLGVILKNEGGIDGAVAVWERIVTNTKGPNDASVNLTDIYFDRDEFEKAAKYYRKLVQWYPKQDAFQEKLTEAEAKLAEGR